MKKKFAFPHSRRPPKSLVHPRTIRVNNNAALDFEWYAPLRHGQKLTRSQMQKGSISRAAESSDVVAVRMDNVCASHYYINCNYAYITSQQQPPSQFAPHSFARVCSFGVCCAQAAAFSRGNYSCTCLPCVAQPRV